MKEEYKRGGECERARKGCDEDDVCVRERKKAKECSVSIHKVAPANTFKSRVRHFRLPFFLEILIRGSILLFC